MPDGRSLEEEPQLAYFGSLAKLFNAGAVAEYGGEVLHNGAVSFYMFVNGLVFAKHEPQKAAELLAAWERAMGSADPTNNDASAAITMTRWAREMKGAKTNG
jgi:hypothetical protein